jgi:transposase
MSNERVNEYVPDVRFERTSLIGAMGVEGIIAPLSYKGTLDSKLFSAYVKECLIPVLKEGDTLILDNATPHKVKSIQEMLRNLGINVKYVPAYSPELYTIEMAWSKIKAYLLKTKARTADKLVTAIGEAIDTLTKDDSLNWLKHSGYGLL